MIATGVEQRRLDFRLDRERLFLVGRKPVEQRLENTGLLAGRDQVAVQRVEKKAGNLRKADASDEPVSTSVLRSMSSFATAGLAWPLAHDLSNDCSRGTPAFIIVAICLVNSATSFSLTLPPLFLVCFLTFVTITPWRRSVALTTWSPAARISPLTTLPVLSLPSQAKLNSLILAGCGSGCHSVSPSFTRGRGSWLCRPGRG